MDHRRRDLVFTLLILAAAAALSAGLSRAQSAAPTAGTLAAFEGHYRYRDDGTLYMVRDGDRLFAIIGDGKYLLRRKGDDVFTNGSGDAIPFVRDAAGLVTAFVERGDTFARLSATVPDTVRGLLKPRPVAAGAAAARYRYQQPSQLDDGLASGPAGADTLSVTAAEQLVNGVLDGTYADVHGIAVYHRGALRLEEYFYGFDANRPHQMRSLTKSVIALLAGIAADRHALDPRAPIVPQLGYDGLANPDARKARITTLDLLSHRSGLACNDYDGASPGNEVKLYEAPDWVKAFLDLPMAADPNTVAHYCSGGMFTTGRVIERATKMPLAAFAQETLFAPLGIEARHWKWPFVLERGNRNEFGQIYLRLRDMVKLGRLIAQRGVWQGRQIVSAAWIDAAVGKQSRIDEDDYGLGIWHRWYRVESPAGVRRVDTIMLSGNGGQKVYIVPSLDLVVAFTGGAYNAESPVNTMMARVLLPALLP